jgi:hypothetical protein
LYHGWNAGAPETIALKGFWFKIVYNPASGDNRHIDQSIDSSRRLRAMNLNFKKFSKGKDSKLWQKALWR